MATRTPLRGISSNARIRKQSFAFRRGKIAGLREIDCTETKIKRHLSLSRSTVHDIVERSKVNNKAQPAPRFERPRKHDARDNRAILFTVKRNLDITYA